MQRTLRCNLAVHESLFRYKHAVPVIVTVNIGLDNPVALIHRELEALISLVLLHRSLHLRRIDKLDHALAIFGLVAVQDPQICIDAGADALVSGSYIFAAQNPQQILKGLKYAQTIRRNSEKVIIYSDSAYVINCYIICIIIIILF